MYICIQYAPNFVLTESLERERDDLRETVGVEKQLHRHRIAELEDALVELRSDQSVQVEQYTEQIQDLQHQYEAAQKKLKINQNFIDVCLINIVLIVRRMK